MNVRKHFIKVTFEQEIIDIFGIYVQLKNVILVSSTKVAQLGQSSPGQGRSSFRLSEILTVLGAVHILSNTLWGGGGLPDLLQY